jgi:hypothetical protein
MQEATKGTTDDDSDGASAFTTKTHQEDMIFGLEPLVVDSKQILQFLTSENFSDTATSQNFQQPNTRVFKKHQNLLARLRDSCETFGESDDLIPIAPIPTIRKIVGDSSWPEFANGQWRRPEAIFQLANLANFAAAVVAPDARSSNDFGVLHTMWEQFPSPFTCGFEEAARHKLAKWDSKLLERTFELGLEIRTQYAISLLSERRSDPNFDPDVVLTQVFYVEDDEGAINFLGFSANGLSVDDLFLPNAFELQVSQRIQALKEHCSEHGNDFVDIYSLTNSFPWESFLTLTMSWVQARAAELGQEIDRQGGIGKIQQSLQEQNNQPRPENANTMFEEPREAPTSLERKIQSPKNVLNVLRPAKPLASRRQEKRFRKSLPEKAMRLKQLKAQRAQGSGMTVDAPQEASTLLEGEDDGSPLVEANFEKPPTSSLAQLVADPAIRMSPVAKVYKTIEAQSRQSNKENIDYTKQPKTFIDRQKGARRVLWNENDQEVGSGTTPNQLSPRKRPRNAGQVDHEDDEDDFEAMTPPTTDRRRKELRDKAGKPVIARGPLSKRSRSEISESVHSHAGGNDDPDYDPDNEQDEVDQQLNNAVAESSPFRPSNRPPSSSQRLPSSTQPARTPLSPRNNTNPRPSSSAPAGTAQHLDRVRESARHMVTVTKPHRVQGRSAYSPAEEERLIELIEDYGSSYTFLKQMDERHPDGPLLLERTQVHLKDKAQDLKFQFLKYVSIIIYVQSL